MEVMVMRSKYYKHRKEVFEPLQKKKQEAFEDIWPLKISQGEDMDCKALRKEARDLVIL